ncbi:MAG TPA: ATP-dependent RNA helicase HrpA [Mycobacteriales bacterium]|nr:ATP-dependent RNA helicase HrpA [Mycobacteriales bacterium]
MPATPDERRLARRRALVPAVSYPDELPVSAHVDDIAAAIRDHQVVVVAGETGSGKTTQLPKVCLALGRGITGTIAHTQPRRIAARAVAERLAAELDVPVGQAVGYQVRFTRRTSRDTLVKVMTDGVLLAEIAHDRDLRGYDTVIVDEAHERSLNIDFLLGYLTRLLPRRPELRVVVTSATIDPQRFADHFAAHGIATPIIEVSGRTYPVEIRYRPPEEGADQVQAVIDAVGALSAEGPGDTLVFLSGEREIRDTAEALRGAVTRRHLDAVEVLPLYGRLSAAEQHRVFAPRATGTRRVVLATNVAETSLTVPGIHYVVDTGTARISRYSHRLKVQRLPIEKISQASARQRAGRCGRVAEGICIRLYDEDDHAARPAYTDPEILRTNLAAVILQMAALDLGDVADFPFLDPPDRRAVRDGMSLLHELGALIETGGHPRLTDLGRRLARLPLDPRLGRMVLEAERFGCVRDVLVVAAALTIQDPRERPVDAQEQADQSHRRFADDSSDVISWLNLWRYLDEQQQALSSSAFRRMCRREFLHYLRIREWQDLVAQLQEIATKDLHLTVGEVWAHPDHVHRALLPGLLSQLGVKEPDGRGYLGARGATFVLWPGSGLAKQQPRWVMAAELVETSRLFARTVARIDPQWVEPVAAHLVQRTYSEPHWDARRGAVMAYERVTLYGIPIVTRRRVGYARVDPALAHELFLRHALVEGEWDAHHAFLQHNRALLDDVRELEDRLRRRDLAVDDEALLAFYAARVPASVVSSRHFDAWWKAARRDTPHLLDLTTADLLAGADLPDPDAMPDTWLTGELALPVTYRFTPGDVDDGATVHLPMAVLNRLPAAAFSWHVPGLRAELATALLRGLPKALRRAFVPAPDTAAAALATMTYDERMPFPVALGKALHRLTAVEVPPDAWDVGGLPTYLRLHLAVSDDSGRVLAVADDLDELRRRLAPHIRIAVAAAAPALERSGLREWPLTGRAGGGLPRTLDTERDGLRVTGYPALVDEGETVGVRVLTTPGEQAAAMRLGTRRLLLLSVPSPARVVLDAMTARDKLALSRDTDGRPADAVRDAITAAIDQLVAEHGGPAWDATGFAALRGFVASRLTVTTRAVLENVAEVHALAHALRERLAADPPPLWRPSYDDLRGQLAALVPPGVATAVGAPRLPHLVRYLQAMQQRLDRLPSDPGRDLTLMDRVHAVEDAWHDALDALPVGVEVPATLGEVRWMLEELRVSLFAQQLGTAHPVSEKRILQAVAAAR